MDSEIGAGLVRGLLKIFRICVQMDRWNGVCWTQVYIKGHDA